MLTSALGCTGLYCSENVILLFFPYAWLSIQVITLRLESESFSWYALTALENFISLLFLYAWLSVQVITLRLELVGSFSWYALTASGCC